MKDWKKQFDEKWKKYFLGRVDPDTRQVDIQKIFDTFDLISSDVSQVEADAIRRSDKVYKDKLEKAVVDALERAAKVAEKWEPDVIDGYIESPTPKEIAQAIRELKG